MSMLADESNKVRSKVVDVLLRIRDSTKFKINLLFLNQTLKPSITLISKVCVISRLLQPARQYMKSFYDAKQNLK